MFGVVALGGRVSEDDVIGPLEAQRHRGPDAEGAWSDGLCALGHRRLAIIDLSDAGRQPMRNEDGTVWIVSNGEVYNFQALRKELAGLGHAFRSASDSEVILHAYEQWGVGCVRRLRGMFAFGLWDQARRRLVLARDRVGKKPLFYSVQAGRLRFASELQGLLADPSVAREVDPEGLDFYLSWGYIPAPRTGFRGIAKLAPAHWLTADLGPDGPVVRTERYWSLASGPKLRITEAEACEGLRALLTEAVRLRMVGDVPLGAFLSGGIDSSVVVGVMAGLSDRPVKTFSIGFDEACFDELEHARRVATRWGTEHHERIVRPDALAILPRLVRHYGEPFADSSAVPTYYVAQVTRSRVTVALTGDGGDEDFLGYDRYRANRMAARIHRVPGLRTATRLVGRRLPGAPDSSSRLHRARRFLTAACKPEPARYARWIGYFDLEAKARLYRAEFRARLDEQAPMRWMATLLQEAAGSDAAEAAALADVHSYLPFDLLVKVDITAMANGLEPRAPFLDHELMEFAARLPAALKLRGGRSKYLVKRAFADLLPRETIDRRKMGFGMPVGRWFRGPLRDLLAETLLSDRCRARGYFEPSEVRRLVTEHQEGQADHTYLLWNLLMLELWHREMIDSVPVQGASPGVVS